MWHRHSCLCGGLARLERLQALTARGFGRSTDKSVCATSVPGLRRQAARLSQVVFEPNHGEHGPDRGVIWPIYSVHSKIAACADQITAYTAESPRDRAESPCDRAESPRDRTKSRRTRPNHRVIGSNHGVIGPNHSVRGPNHGVHGQITT